MIGIHFGYGAVNLVWVKKRGKQLFIQAVKTAPLSSECFDHYGNINNPAEVSVIISSLVKESGIKDDDCVLVLSGRGITLQQILFPPMPPREIDEAVRGELERIPYLAENGFVFDYSSLSYIAKSEGRKTKLILAGIPRILWQTHLSALKDAGLKVTGIDVGISSLLNAEFDNLKRSNDSRGLVFVQQGNTYILVLRNAQINFFYASNLGTSDFLGAGGKPDASGIERLAREIERALRAYQMQQAEYPLEEVSLVWNSEKFPEALNILSKSIEGINLKALEFTEGAYIVDEQAEAELKAGYPLYASCIGAAKRGIFKKVSHELKFFKLQDFISSGAIFAKKLAKFFIISALILLAAGLVSGYFIFKKAQINNEVNKIQKEENSLELKLQELFGLKGDYENLREKLSRQVYFIKKLKRYPWSSLVSDITMNLPQKAWLTKFESGEAGGVLKLSGATLSLELISEFVRNLDISNKASNIELQSIDKRVIKTAGGEDTPILEFGLNVSLADKETQGENDARAK